MPSFSEIRNLFLSELEKHAVKHFTLQQLVRHNLPRDFTMKTIEIHIVENKIIECEDRNTYCEFCLNRRNSGPRLDISNVELYEYAVAYLTLKQSVTSVKDILTEPVPYLLNNLELKEYIQNYLLEDRLTEYINTVIKNINSIRSVYGKEPIQNLSPENLDDVAKMYREEFTDKPKVLFTDIFDIKDNNTGDAFIITRTGNTYTLDSSKCLIITHKPDSTYRVNKFIMNLFVTADRLTNFKNIKVPALSREQLSLLNIESSQFNYYDLFLAKFNEVLESMTGLVL
jgi:hypothetical protein